MRCTWALITTRRAFAWSGCTCASVRPVREALARMRANRALRKLRVPSTEDLDPGPPPMRGRKIGNSRSVVILAPDFRCHLQTFYAHGPESRFCVAEKEVRNQSFRIQLAPRLYLALRIHSGFAKSR